MCLNTVVYIVSRVIIKIMTINDSNNKKMYILVYKYFMNYYPHIMKGKEEELVKYHLIKVKKTSTLNLKRCYYIKTPKARNN